MAYSDLGVRVYAKRPDEPEYEQLICPTSVPDLGGAPESLDTTTMCDPVSTSIPGRQTLPEMAFETWYTGVDHSRLEQYKNIQGLDMIIVMPDGYGFRFLGQLDVWVAGFSVNSVIPMTMQFYPSYKFNMLTPEEVNALIPQRVEVSPIIDRSIAVGANTQVPVFTVPDDAVITAQSQQTGVATVEVQGRVVIVTGVAEGSSTITVTGSKDMYVAGSTNFTVTVVA